MSEESDRFDRDNEASIKEAYDKVKKIEKIEQDKQDKKVVLGKR
jgi:hypothetical protein